MSISQHDLEWIDAVCRRMSRLTGWPMTFAPTEPAADAKETPALVRSDYAWTADVHDGGASLGALVVPLSPERRLDDSFLKACEYADVIAQLLQRVLAQRTTVDHLPQSGDGPIVDGDAWTDATNRVLDVGLRLTGFRSAVLFVLDPQDEHLRMRAVRTCDPSPVILYGRPLAEAPFDQRAIREGSVVIRRKDESVSEWLPEGVSLGACWGITTPQGLKGTLWVFDRRDRRLTVREEQVLHSLAARLADLIEHGNLIEESTLQRQLRAELRIASESQPGQRICVTGAGGWCDVSGRSESAREVGGDLCEVIPLGEQRMLIAIGDAAGHSIPAAMVMATVRGALRALVDEMTPDHSSPETLLERLNRVLHGVVESHQFMTLTCAILDGSAHSLQLANAGHPPPLLIRDGDCREIEAHGLLLGVVDDAVYLQQTLDLLPEDLLIFYTDGVSEAQGREQKLFRSSTIAGIIGRSLDSQPEVMVGRVWSELQSHVEPGHNDDRTLLIVRFAGCRSERIRQLRV